MTLLVSCPPINLECTNIAPLAPWCHSQFKLMANVSGSGCGHWQCLLLGYSESHWDLCYHDCDISHSWLFISLLIILVTLNNTEVLGRKNVEILLQCFSNLQRRHYTTHRAFQHSITLKSEVLLIKQLQSKIWFNIMRPSDRLVHMRLPIRRVQPGLRDRIDLDHLLPWLWWMDDCSFGTDVIGEVGIDQSDE